MNKSKGLRCAIYTRVSTDAGLEQDFNSLDAQHAACSAYVASQASEGWTLISQRYDDGGISGGTFLALVPNPEAIFDDGFDAIAERRPSLDLPAVALPDAPLR